ncbi:hypothetical protein A0H81_08155 [Grifola frondosa]|uniref:Uncharacterized protein n=1 Tax=Grifola frondosa TaxID=5627 RepID=A0A1C7MAB3_GRIFR|nr:hypothetical protein A0H81_08155 [Grifola frondosa]
MPVGQGFSALISATETDEGDSEDITASSSKSKKHKKKKKKPTAVASPTPSGLYVEGSNILVPQTGSTVVGPSKKEKKALKKQKAKEKKDDRDEVDKALAELSVKYPDLQQHVASPANISPAARSASNALSSLLSVSLQHLDSEAEMRKFFGAKVISAAKTSASGSSSPSTRQSAVQRSNLTRPQPTWWPATKREGFPFER